MRRVKSAKLVEIKLRYNLSTRELSIAFGLPQSAIIKLLKAVSL